MPKLAHATDPWSRRTPGLLAQVVAGLAWSPGLAPAPRPGFVGYQPAATVGSHGTGFGGRVGYGSVAGGVAAGRGDGRRGGARRAGIRGAVAVCRVRPGPAGLVR